MIATAYNIILCNPQIYDEASESAIAIASNGYQLGPVGSIILLSAAAAVVVAVAVVGVMLLKSLD